MDLFDTLLFLGGTLGPPSLAILFRKRIGKAIGRMIFASAPEFIDDFLWETVEEPVEAGTQGGVAAIQVVKRLRRPVAAQLEALAGSLLPVMLKSIKINIPKDLPINPKTGQIDLLAPIASKLMRGGKVNAMDILAPFVPTLMQVGQVVGGKVQEFVSGMTNKGKKKEELIPPVITNPDALIQEAMKP